MDVQNFFAQKKIGGVQKCTQKYESEARHIFMFQEMCDGRASFFKKIRILMKSLAMAMKATVDLL